MRILIVNKFYPPWVGGIETVVQQLAEGLSQKAVTVDVLVCAPMGAPTKVENLNGATIYTTRSQAYVLGMPLSWEFFTFFRNLNKKTDLIFLHQPFPLGFLVYLLFAKNKPV